MRLNINLTKNTEKIPLTYSNVIKSRINSWLGKDNPYHDRISLYSYPNFIEGTVKDGFLEPNEPTTFFINSHTENFLLTIKKGIMKDRNFIYGITVKNEPTFQRDLFGLGGYFLLASPIVIKRTNFENKHVYYTFEDGEASELMTETLKNKMKICGLEDKDVSVKFDDSYKYKNIIWVKVEKKGRVVALKSSLCPVIVEGKQSTKIFARNVGIGNLTGMGFGSLR